jgi:hypothetical protein
MKNSNWDKVENVTFAITVIFASLIITMGFLVLVGKIVMGIFS